MYYNYGCNEFRTPDIRILVSVYKDLAANLIGQVPYIHVTPDTKFDKNENLKYLLTFKKIFKGELGVTKKSQ